MESEKKEDMARNKTSESWKTEWFNWVHQEELVKKKTSQLFSKKLLSQLEFTNPLLLFSTFFWTFTQLRSADKYFQNLFDDLTWSSGL